MSATIDPYGRFECCWAPADHTYWCCIEGCRRTDTDHVPSYPDCVDLCPEHLSLHEDEPAW